MDKNYEILTIPLGMVNVFVIKGERIILVDTGSAKHGERLVAELGKLEIRPDDLDLIILTHGHEDHIGALPYLKARTQAKILIHKHDMSAIIEGRNIPVELRNRFLGFLLKSLVPEHIPNYAGVQPDIVVDGEYSLGDYGIQATIVPTPGHTSGSISICFDREVIIGDLMYKGAAFPIIKTLMSRSAVRTVHASIQRVLAPHPEKVYMSHGGVCDYETVKKFAMR